MPTLILRADEGREQQRIPCHLHALSCLHEARARGMERIRVEKPGHACEFLVAALEEHVRHDPLATPKCLVNLTRAEHEALGTWYEPRTPNWSGANFTPRLTSETSHGE